MRDFGYINPDFVKEELEKSTNKNQKDSIIVASHGFIKEITVAKKDIVKEELEKSTNKKIVKKKKGEEVSNEDVVIQDEVALDSSLDASTPQEGISSGDETSGSFWSENSWLIAGGTLGVLGGACIVTGKQIGRAHV